MQEILKGIHRAFLDGSPGAMHASTSFYPWSPMNQSVIPTSILHARTLREIRIISPTSPQPGVVPSAPKPKESSHAFLVIFGFPLIMFHQGKRAFPDTHADRILLRFHVFFLFLATLSRTFRFKIYEERKMSSR